MICEKGYKKAIEEDEGMGWQPRVPGRKKSQLMPQMRVIPIQYISNMDFFLCTFLCHLSPRRYVSLLMIDPVGQIPSSIHPT